MPEAVKKEKRKKEAEGLKNSKFETQEEERDVLRQAAGMTEEVTQRSFTRSNWTSAARGRFPDI